MSRLAVAISGKILWSTGDLRLCVDVDLLLKDSAGNWISDSFRLDTATDVTTFPAFRAKQLNLPMPPKPSSGVVHTQTGLEIRSGLLRLRIQGMDSTEYAVACLFLGDAGNPPSGPPAAFPRKLLQPFGLLNQLRFLFDKDAAAGAPYGEMIIEKK
jgi:hypothetical protein